MKVILSEINNSKNVLPFFDELSTDKFPALINGVCDNALPSFSAAMCERLDRKALFVVPDEKTAGKLKLQLEAYFENVYIYPARNIMYDTVESYSREWERGRISILDKVLSGNWNAIIAVPDAVMQYTLPADFLTTYSLFIERGSLFDSTDLCDKLVDLGYKRADVVEGEGQYSVRGGIVDVFPTGEEMPVRIDLFGDEVDLIGHFDVVTQRRCDSITFVKILPATETLCDGDAIKLVHEYICERLADAGDLKGNVAETLYKEKEAIESFGSVLCPDKYRQLLFKGNTSLLDYIGNALVITVEGKSVAKRARAYYWEISQSLERLTDTGLSDFDTASCCMTDNELLLAVSRKNVVYETFLNTGSTGNYKSYLNISTKQNTSADLTVDVLLDEILSLVNTGNKVLYIAANSVSYSNALSMFTEKGIKAFPFSESLQSGCVAVSLKKQGVLNGFEIPSASLAVITEDSNGVRKKTKTRLPSSMKGERIYSYADLSLGDYVVHINHGIGRFEGLHNLVTNGVSKDYIKISYAAGDTLYVPAGNLDAVSKFIGSTENVKLNRLGGTEWVRAKAKAKASAKNIAKDLIKLYSERNQKIAFACYPDDDMQEEFEAMFEYSETEGQLLAVREIKADMEKSVPMERLLCGDVGFGKTEVALRAVFKAVNSGKQAAILVPTTILALQHYQTIKSRFRGFPVNVGMLSRFNDKRINDNIVAELKSGKMDVVVGTHKLLQKNIGFKDLGLLIIDEEQRFGVTHKERIKTVAKSVHTLTLSATPIPRTLNMALSGIRDMSVLEEAPTNRLPVQSYVLEHDEDIINEAIAKEMRRGGQVFYLNNNIDSLYRTAFTLAEKFPDKNVAVGHGQMDKDELSTVWDSMVKGDIDILVCTTIIETGIDVPNANTLIIENADRMGLAQLHQIRGRVGRSSRRAYAYFTYSCGKVLSEIATKRLLAIKEYTEFGSGFKIAMRDLEIRGAGNLLGAEQHGHIESVGYDLYIKLLQEAVDEEKGIKKPETVDCTVDIRTNAFIPEDYVSSSSMRIDLYRKIAHIDTIENKDDLADEFTDRFGDMPREVEDLLNISLIRHKAAALGFTSVEQKESLVSLYSDKLDMRACVSLSNSVDFRGMIMISAGAKPHLACKLSGGAGVLPTLIHLLDEYGKLLQNV